MYSFKFKRIWNSGLINILIFLLPLLNMSISSALAETIPPNITINSPSNGYTTASNTLVVSGVTEINTSVEVFIDNISMGSIISNGTGNWTLTLNSISEGTHTLVAKATDSTGNIGTSNSVTFNIDLTAPTITILSPLSNGFINLPTIIGKTEANLSVDLYIDTQIVTVTSDDLGQWSYSNPQLQEGSHTVYAKTTDIAGNLGSTGTIYFTFDKTRPLVAANFLPPEDMTRVVLDCKVSINIIDASPIHPDNLAQAIILMENGLPVSGTVNYDAGTQQITFTPSVPLKPFTRYFVSVNPLLKDMAGNLIFPRQWFFLTIGESPVENPHGNYADNVNVCSNCHSTHRSDNIKLEKSDFPTLPQLDIYCNACHDGTAAPIPDNWNSNNKHNFALTKTSTIGADTCGNCHNPHLNWSASNPNFLQDAYFYNHNSPTNPYLPKSSDEQLCEGCHEASIKDDPRVTYEQFKYVKPNNATGAFDDYKLCLRCHDGKSAVDIATFYNASSGHSINSAADGSPINGNLACADCHATHGSNNLKILKEDLGHQNITKFTTESIEWDFSTERLFCSGCHNNTTVVYGKTVPFNDTVPGHEVTSSEFCSKCHGGGSIIKGAHGPTIPVIP